MELSQSLMIKKFQHYTCFLNPISVLEGVIYKQLFLNNQNVTQYRRETFLVHQFPLALI